MSFYGKLAAALVSAALAGGSAAYVMSIGNEVMADVSDISDQLSCYVIREHEGQIALFKDGAEEPVATYSIPAEGINPADHELLREGIRLQDLGEVMRLLEDWDVE